jgi:protein involved in polysaccharide export with SLBB domain
MNWLKLLVFLFNIVLLISCAETPKQYLSIKEFPIPPVTRTDVLRKGDSIDIKFAYWGDLDDSQVIRPDGYISLQLVGEVKADNLTPVQLAEKLKQLYADKIKNPEITVIVRSLSTRTIYVGGEVFTSGEVELKDKMTVLTAVMAAGGFNKTTAEIKNVVVVRFIDDKYYATSVDLENYLHNPQSDPLFLAAQDIIYVPRTHIVEVNQWVEQHIAKLIPKTGFAVETIKTIGDQSFRYGYSN